MASGALLVFECSINLVCWILVPERDCFMVQIYCILFWVGTVLSTCQKLGGQTPFGADRRDDPSTEARGKNFDNWLGEQQNNGYHDEGQ